MAIQAGAKELKYPLPSMYQIGAQQSAAAASSGGSAAASTFSTNRNFAANKMRVQADLANSAAERDYRARAQMQDQGFRATQNYIDRELGYAADRDRQAAQFKQQTALQEQGQAFSAEQQQLDRDFEAQQYATQRYTGIQDAIRRGELELSPAAQAELDKLEAGRRDAPKIVDNPSQQAEFDQQYQQRQRQIYDTARPPRMPTSTERASTNRTFYNQQTGEFADTMQPGFIPGTVDDGGKFEPIVDTSAQDKQRADEEKRQREMEQKQREAEQKLNDEIYKEAKGLVDSEDSGYTDIGAARDAILKQRRSVGASAPEAAPAAPQGQEPAPAAPTDTAPPAPTAASGSLYEEAMAIYDNGRGPTWLESFEEARRRRQGAAQPQQGQQGQQAATTGPSAGWQGPQQQPHKPTTTEEYAKIPSGAMYLDQNGNLMRKK